MKIRVATRYSRLVATAVVVCLLAELGVRVITPRLPDPLEWHSYEAQLKVEQMNELADRGGARIVFLGSSMMNSAADPAQFPAQTDGEVVAYNASLGAGLPQISVPWAENVVYPRLDPKIVVIGVSSLDLAARGRDLYDFFAKSEAARLALGTASLLDRAEHRLEGGSALYRHRGSLRDPALLLRAVTGRRTAATLPEVLSISPLGFQAYLADERYETRDPRARRALLRALPDFEVGGFDAQILTGFIERSEADGRRIVLVKMPVTEEYIALHPNGVVSYREFETELARIASKTHADLIDLDGLRDHKFFADENHLNGLGTERFTRRIGRALAD